MSSTYKLSMLIEEYINKNQHLKSTTLKRRRYIWHLLIDAVSDIDVAEFGYCQAEDFQNWLYGLTDSPSTIRSYRKAVQSIMNWSCRRGHRSGDPFANLRQPKVPETEIRFYGDEEIQALLQAASGDKILQARILASVSAGLRRGEGQNLTIRDINFEKNYISVQSKKETAETWSWSAKNYQVRRVPLVNELANLLTGIIAELPTGQPYPLLTERRYFGIQQLRDRGKLDDRIRTTPDENVRPWKNVLAVTDIEGTFHDLRRTAITRWSWSLPPKELKKLAGHADIETTMKYYAAVRDDVLQRAAKSFNIGATGLEPATS